MSGLIKKDFYLAQPLFKSYAFLYAVFFVLTFLEVYGSNFLTAVLVMVGIMLPVNTFAYDEQVHWDGYAVALPTGRTGYVQAKYLFSLLVSLGFGLLSGLLSALLFFLDKSDVGNLPDAILANLSPVGVTLLLNALLLPLLFRFGTQKGRIFLAIAVGIGVAATVSLSHIFPFSVQIFPSFLPPVLIFPLLGLLLLLPSYFTSLRILQKKDL